VNDLKLNKKEQYRSMSVAEVLEKIQELKRNERRLIFETFEQEFSEDTFELNDAWKTEIEHRLKAYESGEMKTYSREEAFTRARQTSA
jgi:putative addiction module component (TIGR02574 family)